jgi:hypothetical protein
VTSCPDPHDVNHAYSWSAAPGGSAPDGSVFTNLLARLNGVWDAPSAQGCLARHCDWRLPTIAEYQEILVGPAAAPGQASGCSSVPCLDPEFVAVAGPVADVATWATDHGAGADDEAWVVVADGTIEPTPKWLLARTRAVRDGSCAD